MRLVRVSWSGSAVSELRGLACWAGVKWAVRHVSQGVRMVSKWRKASLVLMPLGPAVRVSRPSVTLSSISPLMKVLGVLPG